MLFIPIAFIFLFLGFNYFLSADFILSPNAWVGEIREFFNWIALWAIAGFLLWVFAGD